MAQKIIKVGTSAAVTIPKGVMEKLGYKVGDSIELSVDEKARTITAGAPSAVDSDTLDWARKFMKKYDKALKELAK